MPKASEHQNKAKRNYDFLKEINVTTHPDWAATVAFYTAIHLVERVRAAANHGHSRDHDDRTKYVAEHFDDTVHTAFSILQNVSMIARYQSRSDFFSQFQSKDVQERLVDGHLVTITKYVSGRLDE